MLQDLILEVQQRAARYYATKLFRMQNRGPLVSYTFDNVPDSACTTGAAILEEHGIRGTFYVAAGTCDTTDPVTHWHVITAEQVRGLYDRNHEIGCQTFSRADLQKLSAVEIDEECRRNHNMLRRLCGDIQLTNFAYPFGNVTVKGKMQLQKRFDTCRGILQGINFGTIDLGLLKVIDLYSENLTPEKLQQALRETCDRNGWLIFHSHDVSDSPTPFGCSPKLLRSTVEIIQAMGITCMPVRDALHQIGYVSD